MRLVWPAMWFAYDRGQYVWRAWHGTLLEDKADKAGTLYRRNRAYDPATGRFTQEDPIGLAGGVNLYGFAGGDPANFSDPFGLCANPLAGGLGSLRCALENIVGAVRAGPGILARGVTRTLTDPISQNVLLGVAALIEPTPAGEAALIGARFAQRTFREGFDAGGRFAGRAIDDVAGALRSGQLGADDVPIDYIVRDGNTLILNTRSSQALERAGIPRSQWRGVNRTGVGEYEDRLSGQLRRNNLGSSGTESVRSTGRR